VEWRRRLAATRSLCHAGYLMFWRLTPDLERRTRKARTIIRNRIDLRRRRLSLPFLSVQACSTIDPDHSIATAHEEYTTSVSSPVAAISLELSYALWSILNNIQPRCLVDLGSGFSSYLFRRYQRQRNIAGEECQVISCDDNSQWLQRTALYLGRKHLSVSGLMLWKELLESHQDLRPDLVLHDLGYPPVRVQTLPNVLDLCSSSTILIVDDVHKPAIRRAVLGSVRNKGLHCHDLARVTYDQFGRYSWLMCGSQDSSSEIGLNTRVGSSVGHA
jgi:hypothetical protein